MYFKVFAFIVDLIIPSAVGRRVTDRKYLYCRVSSARWDVEKGKHRIRRDTFNYVVFGWGGEWNMRGGMLEYCR